MSDGAVTQAVPWTFTDAPGLLQWTWVTEHFVARINGSEVADAEGLGGRRIVRAYHWELSDLMRTNQGMPRLLVDGSSSTFEDAEAAVREHVGKCYDARLGYRRFSGTLAFTYTLATGERIDVSPFVGTPCSVTVLQPDGTSQTVTGDFEVHHYRWRLRTTDGMLEIVPEHATRVTNRSIAAEKAAAIAYSSTYTGIGRMYREEPRPGCTGRAGFTVGTVDHAGAPPCPIHEVGIPEHRLR